MLKKLVCLALGFGSIFAEEAAKDDPFSSPHVTDLNKDTLKSFISDNVPCMVEFYADCI